MSDEVTKPTDEAQAVIEAACKSVDLERAWWTAKRKAEVAPTDILTQLAAEADHSEARARCYRQTAPLHGAVDAYRDSLKVTAATSHRENQATEQKT